MNQEFRESRPEVLRFAFEFCDSDDRRICRAEIELEGTEKEIPPPPPEEDEEKKVKVQTPIRGRVLRACILHGEKDGKPKKIDLLHHIKIDTTEIFISSQRLSSYDYDNDANRIVVPPLETLTDIGVFLHEAGHAKQHEEKRFEKVADLYKIEKDIFKKNRPLDLELLRTVIVEIREVVPEIAHLITDEHLKEFSELWETIMQEKAEEERRHILFLGMHEKERDAEKKDTLRKNLDGVQKEIQGLDAELDELLREFQIREIVMVATKILERDATRRALAWAREIREVAGIDLFARHVVPAQPTAKRGRTDRHLGSTADSLEKASAQLMTETDILEDLKRGLQTYGADRLRMRDPENSDDVGITPTAGGTRRRSRRKK